MGVAAFWAIMTRTEIGLIVFVFAPLIVGVLGWVFAALSHSAGPKP
jgi:hypothetical protein